MSNPFIFGPPPPPPKSSSSSSQQSWSANRGGSTRGGGHRGTSFSTSGRGRGRGRGSAVLGGGSYRENYGNTARGARPEVSPAVPAFGTLPQLRQPVSPKHAPTLLKGAGETSHTRTSEADSPLGKLDISPAKSAISSAKPVTNLLGLTPNLDDPGLLSSDSEGSVDEEAEAARFNNPVLVNSAIPLIPSSGASSDLHVFSFRGKTLDLRSPEAIAAWIASRRANFPTKQKVEEKLALKAAKDEERRKEFEERQRKRKEEREEENKRRQQERDHRGSEGTGARKRPAPRQRPPPTHRKSLYQRMRENDLEHENRVLVNLIRALGDQGYLD